MPSGSAVDGFDLRAEANLHSHFAQALGKEVCKTLEAALKGAEAGGARLDAGPHPSHVHVLIVGPELADKERLPHLLIDISPSPFEHPLVGSHLFQRTPVIRQAQVQSDEAEA